MDKKKNVTPSAAAGNSRSAPTINEAIKNLKTLIQLVNEVEELRKENKQLRHQLVAATDIIKSVPAHLKAAEMRLLAAKDEKKMELAELKERLRADSHRGRWKK